MSLITCPECKKKISDSASSCPNCGYQLTPEKVIEIKKKEQQMAKKVGAGCFIVIVIFVICMIMLIILPNSKKTKVGPREERIKKQFSSWDGSHYGLTAFIKKTMNDPDSYKHVETVYWDKGNHLIVKTTFRGKNAFGGVVTNWIMAKVDLDGNVLEIISRGP